MVVYYRMHMYMMNGKQESDKGRDGEGEALRGGSAEVVSGVSGGGSETKSAEAWDATKHLRPPTSRHLSTRRVSLPVGKGSIAILLGRLPDPLNIYSAETYRLIMHATGRSDLYNLQQYRALGTIYMFRPPVTMMVCPVT
jgi:hypothetical protein